MSTSEMVSTMGPGTAEHPVNAPAARGAPDSALLSRARHRYAGVPDFSSLTADLTDIYRSLLGDRRGAVADYIPELANVPPDLFGVSVCTVDGRQFAIGDADTGFSVQSVCKPVNYCLALREHGADVVHRHVGHEPSGRGFNELSLNSEGRPHNPMINSGAIMTCSLLRAYLPSADRLDLVVDTWRRMTGGSPVRVDNAMYVSERRTADRNFALGYFMREHNAFPADTDLMSTMDLYFQTCSIETTARGLSSVAATLATGGHCPLTDEQVFTADITRKCLSLMSLCGMYDYSGRFAFNVGLPAKSGVSGALMVVVPQTMGICVWSPRLDALGNSVRGIEFCRELARRHRLHMFDGLISDQ